MKLWIKEALKLYKKKLLRIINGLVYDEGILERQNPKVLLTASAACTGVSYGQKAMKFVTFILYDFSKQRFTDLFPSAKWSWDS